MKLTLAAFTIALVAVALLVATAGGQGFTGVAEQPRTQAAGAPAMAPTGEKGRSGAACIAYCFVSAGLLVGGIVSAVYGVGVWSVEKGPLSRGLASIKAAFHLSLGGVLLGASLVVYGAAAGRPWAVALGLLAVAANLYVAFRAWTGVRGFRSLLAGGA